MALETLKLKARDELIRLYNDSADHPFSTLNAKQQSIAAAKFYIQEINNKIGVIIPDEDIEFGIVDGSNDLGCDFIYRNDGLVTIIQAKYRKGTTIEPASEITHFRDIFSRLRNGSLTANKALVDVLSEVDWDHDQFSLVYMTFGKIPADSQSRKIADMPVSYPKGMEELDERCDWQTLDEEDLNIALRSARDMLKGISDKQIDLYPSGSKGKRGAESVIRVQSGDYNSFVMTLDARQIQRMYEALGRDTLFSLNIRNYIGNTKTNKAIIHTAETEPDHFFLFNNGISCVATSVIVHEDKLTIKGLQVINGAQTVKSIVHVAANISRFKKDSWSSNIPSLLVRITEVPGGYGQTAKMRERITQYNNTQNTVKISDFRSNDNVQNELKEQFSAITRSGKKVCYLAKRTDRVPNNSEPVKLEEFAKSVYTFLYDFVPFSGSSSFLFNDETGGGYVAVFGDGKVLWERMPDDEFRLRAAIYWVSQEISGYLKRTRPLEPDADAKAAIERKWTLIYAFAVVVRFSYSNDDWKAQMRKLYKGDWTIEGQDKKSQLVHTLYNRAKGGVVMAYKNAKRNNKDFVHRNWMRGKSTPDEIKSVLEDVILPAYEKLPPIPS